MAEPPEHIELIGNEVAIRWPDQSEDYFPMEFLRAASPSAENQGEKDILGHIHGGSGQKEFPNVRVLNWTQVGNYALQFTFSDGHRTGIYSFDYLKKLSQRLSQG